MQEDYATEQTIADMLTMYPDIAEKVSGDPRYQGGNLRVKAALIRKALGDKEAQAEFDQHLRKKDCLSQTLELASIRLSQT